MDLFLVCFCIETALQLGQSISFISNLILIDLFVSFNIAKLRTCGMVLLNTSKKKSENLILWYPAVDI